MPTKVSPERPGRIYVLTDPRTDQICYLGITTLSIQRRFSMHKSSVTGGKTSVVYEWIRELRELSLEPSVSLVEDNVIDPEREVYWIALLHDVDVVLKNMDHGGTGKGKTLTAEHARKIGLGHEGIKRTLESRLKQVRSRNRGRAKGAASDNRLPKASEGRPTMRTGRPDHDTAEQLPAVGQWEDVEPRSTDVARVDSPITGSVLGQNLSRIRDIAARMAHHDELRDLPIIEAEVPSVAR